MLWIYRICPNISTNKRFYLQYIEKFYVGLFIQISVMIHVLYKLLSFSLFFRIINMVDLGMFCLMIYSICFTSVLSDFLLHWFIVILYFSSTEYIEFEERNAHCKINKRNPIHDTDIHSISSIILIVFYLLCSIDESGSCTFYCCPFHEFLS